MSAYKLNLTETQPDDSPDLSLIAGQAPEKAFFESGINFVDNELQWPQLSFKFKVEYLSKNEPNPNMGEDLISETNIFGGPMGTYPENRLRSAVRTLQQLVPSLIELPAPTERDSLKNKKPPTIAEVHKDTNKKLDIFLNKSIRILGFNAVRSNLVTKADVTLTYQHEYRRINHPVFQLIDEIAARNEERKAQNTVMPGNAVRVLLQSEIELLYHDLIIMAERPRIIKRAEQGLAAMPIKLAAIMAIHHTLHNI